MKLEEILPKRKVHCMCTPVEKKENNNFFINEKFCKFLGLLLVVIGYHKLPIERSYWSLEKKKYNFFRQYFASDIY